MTEKNPFAGRLATVSWIGIAGGIALALISNGIETTSTGLFGGIRIDESAIFGKFATAVLSDALLGIGVAAAIGWTVLAGVEWRVTHLARHFESQAALARSRARRENEAEAL